jgi:cytoskeletal protein RodZ
MNKNIFEIFSQARKTNNLTIQTVAKNLKVSSDLVEKIEQGDFGALPPKVFLKPILTRYANLLGLEENIAELYIEEYIKNHPQEDQNIFLKNRSKYYKFSFGARELWILALFLLGIYFLFQINNIFAPAKVDFDQKIKEDIITSEDKFLLSGTLSNSKTIVINGERIGVDRNGKFRYTLNLKPGENLVEIKAYNNRGIQTTIFKKIIYKPNQ